MSLLLVLVLHEVVLMKSSMGCRGSRNAPLIGGAAASRLRVGCKGGTAAPLIDGVQGSAEGSPRVLDRR